MISFQIEVADSRNNNKIVILIFAGVLLQLQPVSTSGQLHSLIVVGVLPRHFSKRFPLADRVRIPRYQNRTAYVDTARVVQLFCMTLIFAELLNNLVFEGVVLTFIYSGS